MTAHWKEVLPVDSYHIQLANFITEVDLNIVTLLYQPLIGADAIGLYHSFVSQLPAGVYEAGAHTHQHLSVMVGLSMADLLHARKKLEAIDLLRTYRFQTDEGERSFLYDIQAPMKPKQFFEDDVLSVFLFNRLGKHGYRAVKERFKIKKIDQHTHEEITAAFSDVFTSLQPSEMQPKLIENKEEAAALGTASNSMIGKEKQGLSFHSFDIELMKQALSSYVVPDEVITEEALTLIQKLAFVYQVEPLTMANLIERSTFEGKLWEKSLRDTVKSWYKLESSSVAPALGLKSQPLTKRTVQAEPKTDEERVTVFYERTAPLTLLGLRQQGASVSPADAKLIEELMIDYILNPGVVNVLIDYSLFQNDMKLSRQLLQKIAGHWKRKKIETVPEAMALVKLDKQKKKEVQSRKITSRRNTRQDTLPKWLLQEKSDVSQKETAETLAESEDATKEMEALLAERDRRRAQKGEG